MERLIQKRAGRLPVFAMVIGDEISDDVMFEVSEPDREGVWEGYACLC